MKAVVQRVSRAAVAVAGKEVAAIGDGLLVLLGIAHQDDDGDLAWLADKVLTLRVFEDDQGRMNRSVQDIGGNLLVVSQFTLLADTTRGRRPSFFDSMPPDRAEPMVDAFAAHIRDRGTPVQQGIFGATMAVDLVNQGPVTIILDSTTRSRKHRR